MNKQLQSSIDSVYLQQTLQPSSENDKQQQRQLLTSNDEIDLKNLFLTFWNEKAIIISCILFFGTIATIYVANQQEWWTSKAIVTVPNINQISPLTQEVNVFQNAFDVTLYKDDGNENVDDEVFNTTRYLDTMIDVKSILDRFILIYNSTDNKIDFFHESTDFNKIKTSFGLISETDEKMKRAIMNEWFSRINAIKNTKNTEYTLSFQSVSDENSYLMLSSYIKFTNKKVENALENDLYATVNIRKHELEQQLKFRLKLAEQNLKLEIIRAEYALKIAKAAKVVRPLENWNADEIYSIALGSDGIVAKIEVLKSINNLWVLDPNIEIIANKIEFINNSLVKVENFQVINFLEYPEKPIKIDKNNKVLIFMLALMLGCVTGMTIVILRNRQLFKSKSEMRK